MLHVMEDNGDAILTEPSRNEVVYAWGSMNAMIQVKKISDGWKPATEFDMLFDAQPALLFSDDVTIYPSSDEWEDM